MNRLMLVLVLLSLSTAYAGSEGIKYSCRQRTDRTPIIKNVGEIRATVLIGKDITKEVRFGGQYDSVHESTVEVFAMKNGKKTILKPKFKATLTMFDVILDVWAKKSQGVSVRIYLDELEESSLTLTDSLGREEKIYLTCE